jgi:uncharacterized membrane protein YhiD involved in acid resistance
MKAKDVVAAAILIPVVAAAALWLFRRLGQWLLRSMQHSFGQVVLEVMAPDMAHMTTKVTASVDDMREANSADHARVQAQLGVVDDRLTDVEARCAAIEALLHIRPPNARTRVTDTHEGGAP